MLLREGGAKEPEISALLRRAVELKPDLVEAHYMLGFYASNAGRFGDAVAHLHQVKKLEKGQAYPYFRTLAYAYCRLGRPEEAKKNAESAFEDRHGAERCGFGEGTPGVRYAEPFEAGECAPAELE